MAHLRDMEELVGSIQTVEIRDYMTESLSCYMAGAYRALVVLTFIALFDDIISKLGELGKVNKKAKVIHDNATQKRKDQEVFETYLIDQLKSTSLLSSLDATFLDTLRTLRNKAAHPSGHHASAEEARFVFYEAVTRFLSRPILSTTQLADEVLASMGNENLFPSTHIDVIAKVTAKELQNIHQETHPYLISKLLEKTQSSDGTSTKNARFFLTGFARGADGPALQALRKYAIEKTAANHAYQSEILSLLCAKGELFQDLDEVTYARLAALVGDRIEKIDLSVEHTSFSHPASLFRSLFSANDEKFILEKLRPQYEAFLERFPYSAYFSSKVSSHAEAKELLLSRLYRNAGSVDFGTANGFVKNLSDIEKLLGDALLPQEAFRMLVNVIRAAEIGAFSAIDMRNAHFGSVEKLRAKAYDFMTNDLPTAKAIASEILGLPEHDDMTSLGALQPPGSA